MPSSPGQRPERQFGLGRRALGHHGRPALFQRRAPVGRRHRHRSPASPRADRAAGQSAGSARPSSDRASQFARRVRTARRGAADDSGRDLERTVRAGADGGGRPDHRTMVRRQSDNIATSRRRCGARARIARTGVCSGPSAGSIPKRRGPSSTPSRIIAHARSTVSGPPRRICTTARYRPCRTCSPPQHQRPKVSSASAAGSSIRSKVGLAQPEGGACGAYTRFDAGDLGNSNLGHSFEGTETDIEEAAERGHRSGADATRTRCAGRISEDALSIRPGALRGELTTCNAARIEP